jgi:hypothetical protein
MLKRLLAGTKALLIILLLFSSACSREDEVVKIRALIKQGGTLAEKHDLQGLLALTSGNFVAFPGGHDRRGVKGILGLFGITARCGFCTPNRASNWTLRNNPPWAPFIS